MAVVVTVMVVRHTLFTSSFAAEQLHHHRERARVAKDLKNKKAQDGRLMAKAVKSLSPDQLMRMAGVKVV